MRTTIDSAGRIVIPKEIRAAAGLEGPAEVEIEERNGIVEIKPAPAKVKIVQHGKVWVIEHEDGVPPLTLEQVNAIRDELRNRRR
ncbi:MAG TPA: AbrB/MazE/SpoVT family DNA-binding domain-containing protein [Thermoanaerobaculia bacterium]|jgi:AbrB family looped-hinge helix DNA binding protein|nr:AbrB/MazE/SpoVT family DNA-binding domain-containing protein [Thermoanaerobaculia bacterium]